MQLRSIPAAALAALAFTSLPALAVDGVILIDQNKALAGNVTPGDAGGYPVTLSRPGSYRLSGNLTAPAGTHGILIASPGVTVDLNGFTLASEGLGGTFPAGVTDGTTAGNPVSQPRAEIRNGHITGFSAAVQMWGSRAVVVEGLRVLTPGGINYTIMVGPYSRVQRNIIDGAGFILIDCPSVTTENITAGSITGAPTLGNCIYYHNRSSNFGASISE